MPSGPWRSFSLDDGNEKKGDPKLMEQVLCVTFFGGFSLSCPGGGKVISEQERASQRLWSFLEYLCAFHQNGVGQEELIAALWEASVQTAFLFAL